MGTKFSLKNPNPGAWFSFDEADPGTGKICLRAANRATLGSIEKAHAKKRIEYKHGQRFEVRDVDSEGYSKALWDYCIVGWEGLLDDDGKKIECTTDIKYVLMTENIGFATFVGGCLDKLGEERDAIRERAEKNSLSTSSD